MSRHTLLLMSGLFLASLALVTAGQAPAAAPFTAAQAAAGRTAYDTTCAGCHGADLAGPPPLAGAAFRGGWGSRSTRDLLTAVQSMPPDQPGGLPEATYLSIVAYILQSNGAAPGTQALTTATTVPPIRAATGVTWASTCASSVDSWPAVNHSQTPTPTPRTRTMPMMRGRRLLIA